MYHNLNVQYDKYNTISLPTKALSNLKCLNVTVLDDEMHINQVASANNCINAC